MQVSSFLRFIPHPADNGANRDLLHTISASKIMLRSYLPQTTCRISFSRWKSSLLAFLCVLLFFHAFHLSFIIGGLGGNVKKNLLQSFIPKPEPVVSHSEPLSLRRTLIAVPEGKLRPLGTDGVLNSSSWNYGLWFRIKTTTKLVTKDKLHFTIYHISLPSFWPVPRFSPAGL